MNFRQREFTPNGKFAEMQFSLSEFKPNGNFAKNTNKCFKALSFLPKRIFYDFSELKTYETSQNQYRTEQLFPFDIWIFLPEN